MHITVHSDKGHDSFLLEHPFAQLWPHFSDPAIRYHKMRDAFIKQSQEDLYEHRPD